MMSPEPLRTAVLTLLLAGVLFLSSPVMRLLEDREDAYTTTLSEVASRFNFHWHQDGYRHTTLDRTASGSYNFTSLDLRNCSQIGAGWSKRVFACPFLPRVAIRTPHWHGTQFTRCLAEHAHLRKTRTRLCIHQLLATFLADTALAAEMQGEDSVPEIYGYSIPLDADVLPLGYDVTARVFVLTERGEPLDTLGLVALPWRERTTVILRVLRFLQRQRHLRFNDLRMQQFILVNGTVKMVDFDDATRIEGTDDESRPTARRVYEQLMRGFLRIEAPPRVLPLFDSLERAFVTPLPLATRHETRQAPTVAQVIATMERALFLANT